MSDDLPLAGPGDIIRMAARKHAAKTALITAAAQFTYGDLDGMCARAASGLRSRGVRPGQTVTLYGPNSWQWVVAYHAVLRAGAVVNPINVMLTPPEVAYVLADCRSVAVLTSAAHLPKLAELAASLPEVGLVLGLDSDDGFVTLFESEPAEQGPVDPAALCTIGYTSGTTGHPKGAMQSQRSVLLNCALTATMHGRTSADVVVTALPAPHVYGNVAINGTFLAGEPSCSWNASPPTKRSR
jgi:long-chain acyl-CoA synthetase